VSHSNSSYIQKRNSFKDLCGTENTNKRSSAHRRHGCPCAIGRRSCQSALVNVCLGARLTRKSALVLSALKIRTRALGPQDAGDCTQSPALAPLSMASRTHVIRVGLELHSMLRRARLCSLARRRLLACALSHRGCWRPERARTLSALERKPAGWVQMRVPSQEQLPRANREGGAVAQLCYNGVGSSCQG
jgi:hypothetical protein